MHFSSLSMTQFKLNGEMADTALQKSFDNLANINGQTKIMEEKSMHVSM